jgi:hypothetical protein
MLSKEVQKLTKGVSKRKLVRESADFFKEYLFKDTPRLMNFVYIDLKLRSGLDCYGEVCWEDDNLRPREFNMTINKDLPNYDIVSTAAHEMVHVWQYASGKFKNYLDGNDYFDGRLYKRPMSYEKRPWEKEAYRMETRLVKKWIKHVKKNGLYEHKP